MFEAVTESVNKLGRFSKEDLQLLFDRLEPMVIPKGDSLIQLGDVCRGFFFLEAGAFRHYYLTSEYHEITLNLFVPGDWMLDHQSFTTQKPSKHQIEAFEEGKIMKLSIDNIHELIALSPSFFQMGKILEKVATNRHHQNTRVSPEEKYTELMRENAKVIQKFPMKYIASYLGITPETLSRVRRKMAE